MEARTPTEIPASPRVALCVPTYRRPVGLARLLGALADLERPGPADRLELVVIDNDPLGSAREVCERFRDDLAFPLRYRIEKRRGIAQARNAALAACLGRADLVAFLDDDELPERDWLVELVRVQRETGADAVTGPCLPLYAAEPPDWVEAGDFFVRPRWKTGHRLEIAYTGNVLVTTRSLAEMESLFDERLGLIGGEDTDFFLRFSRAGHGIVWCDTAVIRDEVPEECATLRWILARAYRNGAATAYIARKLDPGPERALRVGFHGLRCLAKAAVFLLASPLRGRAAAARALHLASFGVGRIGGLAGLQHSEYRVIRGG
ncbi:MAG: glycosyltransferase [Myxococcota bacterium]